MGGALAGWLGAGPRGGAALALAAGEPASLAPPGYGWALVKLLVALFLVCALAYVALWLLRRRLRAARGAGAASLRVVERLPLSSRQSLFLVELAGRYLVIGVGESGTPSRIAELDPDTVRREDAEGRKSFWQILQGHRPDAARAAKEEEP
jgi:flagellar biosynthetic protein FliO